MGRRRTRPEEDVEIGATTSPAVGALGATSDVIHAAVIGKVVSKEIKVVGARQEDEVLTTITGKSLTNETFTPAGITNTKIISHTM